MLLLASASGSAPAWATHPGGNLGVPGLSEKQLRAFEKRVLGPRTPLSTLVSVAGCEAAGGLRGAAGRLAQLRRQHRRIRPYRAAGARRSLSR